MEDEQVNDEPFAVRETPTKSAAGIPAPLGFGRILVYVFGYFVLGALTLLIGRIQGDIGEGLCGVWGCFPPMQALVSMHLLWCLAATAIVHWLSTRNPGDIRLEGIILMLLSSGAIT